MKYILLLLISIVSLFSFPLFEEKEKTENPMNIKEESDRLFCVVLGGTHGIRIGQGKFINIPQLGTWDISEDWPGDLAISNSGGKYGYINKEGQYIIKPQYDYARDFTEDLSCVKTGNKWGYINKEGKYIINPKFDKAGGDPTPIK